MTLAPTTVSTDIAAGMDEMTRKALSACYQCGTCTAVCPVGVPVRGIVRAAQLGIRGMSAGESRLWNCATCKLCELSCPRRVSIVDVLHFLRIASAGAKGTPSKLETAMWGVYEDGNPWGGSRPTRAKWAEGLHVRNALEEKVDYLLYVGCAASFDTRLQRISRSLVRLLDAAGVNFGVLGSSEDCCGDVVYQAGEEGFLEELVQKNLGLFDRTGAQGVVSISPHCHTMFKDVYPRYGTAPRAVHYTELLAELLDKGRLKAKGAGDGATSVTYHDPCYLGRYQGVYEQPRKILESIPGVKLLEMDATRSNALCCGGGGGQMWLDVVGDRPSHKRVQQAVGTGASALVTSCPYCVQNFEDAAKTSGLNELRVSDIAELLADRIDGSGV
jgi:Fe-S oxidoreductase